MQYLKQMPLGDRVPSTAEEYATHKFLDNVIHIIRTENLTVYRAIKPGEVPTHMPPPEKQYRYARAGQR